MTIDTLDFELEEDFLEATTQAGLDVSIQQDGGIVILKGGEYTLSDINQIALTMERLNK